MKTKLILILAALGIVGVATPAMARPPRYHDHSHVEVGVSTPVLHVGLDWGRHYDRYDRFDRYNGWQYRRGVALENEGRQLIAEGRDLEWRGRQWGNWHDVRRGERLQRRGYDLVQQGQELQARSRY